MQTTLLGLRFLTDGAVAKHLRWDTAHDMSLFGQDLAVGERASARVRLVLSVLDAEPRQACAQVDSAWGEFASDCEAAV